MTRPPVFEFDNTDSLYYIGVDPGASTGFAIWSPSENKLIAIKTLRFMDAWSWIETLAPHKDRILFVIEDPSLNAPVFIRDKQSIAAMRKIAQNVGSNKRDAQLLIDLVRKLGFQYTTRRPSGKKWGKNIFPRITGYTRSTSQHGRDAARMVFGMK